MISKVFFPEIFRAGPFPRKLDPEDKTGAAIVKVQERSKSSVCRGARGMYDAIVLSENISGIFDESGDLQSYHMCED